MTFSLPLNPKANANVDTLAQLPRTSGVYIFKGTGTLPLYIGKSVDILYADIEEGRELRGKALKSENYIGEIENIRKDGNAFTTLLSIAFMRDKEGEVIGSVGVSRDITEQKKTQKERIKLQFK